MKSNQVVNVLRKDSEAWIKKLSPEEEHAIKKNTKNSGDPADDKFYARLNAMLRGEIPTDDTLKYYSEQISNGISKFKLEHNIVCYRNMDSNPFGNVSVGQVIRIKQFMSTSVTRNGALDGDFKITVNVEAGSRGAYIELLSKYKKQREFLLDKGVEYKVISVGNNTMELEVQ